MDFYQNGNYFLAIDNKAPKRKAVQLATSPTDELIPRMPELVDVKLTDVCFIGCSFCYQASTKDSAHGDLGLIKGVIDQVDGNITEVAFGGGDVLQHPNIKEILEYSKSRGIVSSNITVNWQSILRYPDKLKEVAPLVTAFGISVTNARSIKRTVDKLKEIDCFKDQRNCFHIIPDLYSEKDLLAMMEEVKNNAPLSDILFLGFKSLGRGGSQQFDNARKISEEDKAKMAKGFEFCIENNLALQCDTKFINDYREIVDHYSRDHYYDPTEGKFSMNVDCVDQFYSIASYNLSYLGDLKDLIEKGMDYAFGDTRQRIGLTKFKEEEHIKC